MLLDSNATSLKASERGYDAYPRTYLAVLRKGMGLSMVCYMVTHTPAAAEVIGVRLGFAGPAAR